MTEQETSTAVVRRAVELPAAVLSDDEIRRMYRLAESLYQSGAYDDIKKAEMAFAKMLLGKDLGLSPTQAMGGIHLVKGGVQVHYSMLARFINSRAEEGYAYRPGWIYQNDVPEGGDPRRHREAVWFDEDDPLDLREIVGAFVQFSIQGQQVGISRYALEDAETAGLIKPGLDPKAAWATNRRNMYLARAMSNGVKWLVPEVMGGLPIYVTGELVDERNQLSAVSEPAGDGGDEGTGLDLGPKVEEVIARAETLGHRGLSNRAALELQLGKRSPGVVNQFVRDAHAALDEFAARSAERGEDPEPEDEKDAPPEGEIPEAEVVHDDEEQPPIPEADPQTAMDMEEQILRKRIEKLEAMRAEEQNPEQRALIDEEIELLQGQLGDNATTNTEE